LRVTGKWLLFMHPMRRTLANCMAANRVPFPAGAVIEMRIEVAIYRRTAGTPCRRRGRLIAILSGRQPGWILAFYNGGGYAGADG